LSRSGTVHRSSSFGPMASLTDLESKPNYEMFTTSGRMVRSIGLFLLGLRAQLSDPELKVNPKFATLQTSADVAMRL